MSISNRLFETAIQDLNSAEILYNSNHYNLALFQLQQSVEKFVKSFGIKTGIIKSEDIARKINHLPHKVFSQLYQKQIEELSELANTPLFISDMIPPHQRGKSKRKENLENLKGLHYKITNVELLKIKEIPTDQIESFIEGAYSLDKEPIFDDEELFSNFKDDIVKTNKHFIEYFKGNKSIKTLSEDLINKSNEIAKNKVITHKRETIRESKFAYICYVWINLSLMTSPHEQSTRYPSTINDESPQNVYTINHNIIKHIPEFIELMRRTIENYNQIYEN
ncbi:HEPN domain-containing protein [uncultured Flavobacterium sp.]|uniref:HEPN domain-containing protein n=1 Tax=uncultured Flavobacterium sp. TaxID=165435 RepID=UPI0030C8C237